jgi:acetylornithine deacetylase
MTTRNPVQLLKKLVSIPSVSGHEERIVDEIFNWVSAQNLRVERKGRNLVITIGKPGKRRLLYNSHVDTVAPVTSWETDPYSPVIVDDKIIGLGANDAKGPVTAMLFSIANSSKKRLDGEVILALTVDEEIEAVNEGLEQIIGELGNLDAAVIGEPTNLSICRSQKGRLLLEVETRGLARHAAHAHRITGKNAIVEAGKAIAATGNWTPGPDHPLLGPTTAQITTILGGDKQNVIPDRCTFTVDIRTVDDQQNDLLVAELEEITGAKVNVLSDRQSPFETDENSKIVTAAKKALPQASVVASATMSDAVWTRHLPTIKIGPGRTERSHTAGEYITIDELTKGIAFYEQLIENFFNYRQRKR